MTATVGKQYLDLQQNTDNYAVPIVELTTEMTKDYLPNLVKCIDHARKKVDCSLWDNHNYEKCQKAVPREGSFFIEVLKRGNKFMDKMIRSSFESKSQCPRPNYDQDIFFFDALTEDLKYIWSVPDKKTCQYLLKHALEVAPEEKQLLNMVIEFADGSLHRKMKQLNGEAVNSLLLER